MISYRHCYWSENGRYSNLGRASWRGGWDLKMELINQLVLSLALCQHWKHSHRIRRTQKLTSYVWNSVKSGRELGWKMRWQEKLTYKRNKKNKQNMECTYTQKGEICNPDWAMTYLHLKLQKEDGYTKYMNQSKSYLSKRKSILAVYWLEYRRNIKGLSKKTECRSIFWLFLDLPFT